jgi:predicted Rossmann fold nucleotide-binding protein DprA/Smf involved in DNA uptake
MAQTQLAPDKVPADTQAVLLLCATFSRGSDVSAKPLSLLEYNAVARSLGRNGRRPADLLESSEEWLPDEAGIPSPARLKALLGRGVQMATALERWQRLGVWVISRGESRYPERLRKALQSSAPVLLYGVGDVSRLGRGGLAMVGSRNIDEEGLAFTTRVASRCTRDGVQVVSGGARGVDQAAVSACLESGGGAVAVLAERLDRAATSREGKQWIRDGMLTLVSPFEPESTFTVYRAMGRNKHIYALSDYALVVRFTTGEGGTWAGAVEQLGRAKTNTSSATVFVRENRNPAEGLRELCQRGARAFPEEEFWQEGVACLLTEKTPPSSDLFETASADEEAASEADAALPEPAPHARASETGRCEASPVLEEVPPEIVAAVDSCYSLCLPLILSHLPHEPGLKPAELAPTLALAPTQTRAWLKRAVQDGKVIEKRKPVLYLNASRPHEGEPKSGTNQVQSAETCYSRCLPLLLQMLRQERSEKDLAQLLGVLPAQVKLWVHRARKENRIISTKKKPVILYRDASLAETSTLFDRDGDAA